VAVSFSPTKPASEYFATSAARNTPSKVTVICAAGFARKEQRVPLAVKSLMICLGIKRRSRIKTFGHTVPRTTKRTREKLRKDRGMANLKKHVEQDREEFERWAKARRFSVAKEKWDYDGLPEYKSDETMSIWTGWICSAVNQRRKQK
jgi:hypothetical protein